ncbi:DUF302 domain-containing protein [Photobacterium sp. GJ3]|uniref:DUF302 domain-containing protein n=1 Tax=Photobacterium sp. GJ3 TaxID=2829502 RepID=UPI001B8D2871|nr:DUF302 domain-containing protein [Photobacterium sp. GJ3]QUJ68671.1 DUF302 domain-containing protein [Photobacterium sp. GJ3]
MKFITLALVLMMSFPLAAIAQENGLIRLKSAHSVASTVERLETALKSKGMTVFARIDHAAGARKAGIHLRPTILLIFGNPRVGSPLMVCAQSVALDLPQKMLVSQDEFGMVWLMYNDPQYLVARHQIEGCEDVIQKIELALASFAKIATQP